MQYLHTFTYTYLHLVDLYGLCRWIYQTWILWVLWASDRWPTTPNASEVMSAEMRGLWRPWIVEADFRTMHDIPPFCWLWKIAKADTCSHNKRLAWKIFDIFMLISQVLCLGHTWFFFWNGENTWFSCHRSSGMWTHLPRLKSRVKFEVDSPNWWNFMQNMFWPKKYGVFSGDRARHAIFLLNLDHTLQSVIEDGICSPCLWDEN